MGVIKLIRGWGGEGGGFSSSTSTPLVTPINPQWIHAQQMLNQVEEVKPGNIRSEFIY